jgi:putative spermidine/putrescine transport system permease protein
MPLWAGYLVKGYAWKTVLRPGGVSGDGGFLNSVFGVTPGFGRAAVVLALAYLWLPFMILPIYAGLERLPASLLDASSDLGARPLRTFRSVIAPMLVPSIAAGSIFTFSLSLGDYITPQIVTEGKETMIGSLIARTLLAPNQPLAAAFTLWPLLIIVVYLAGMKRLGAFESL